MRWDSLFDDFEAQLASATLLEHEAHVAELVRAEQAGLGLVDRLRGHGGAPAELLLRAGVRLRGRITQLADAWFVVDAAPHSALVPVGAVVSVSGLGRVARSEASAVRRTLSLASGLRALARDRALVSCFADGGAGEPHVIVGTIDTVGRDYIELAVRRDDAWSAASASTALVPFGSLIAVRSGG
ncbi:hypothetical protein [Sinomonas mesophila]|uniref:hypothetical protein n=1 Tax=Sinomonas mesophila TaxID=1531955 RepID=UPI000984CE98|nr:hypothetical protein [Sinomonas mesophila]